VILDSTHLNEYHRAYYDQNLWGSTTYRGHTIWKCVTDLWVYQEIIWDTKPDLIIECGTAYGGSALYMADVMSKYSDSARVVSIDITERPLPEHPLVRYRVGSSLNPAIVADAARWASGQQRVMVVLDSDHSKAHVLRELYCYAELVTPGCYLIVEDTNVNGHPVFPEHGPGPAEALNEWLPRHPEFQPDRSCERFGMTFNPGGYLLRMP
jgi:cephalosporin hydroxylase